MDWRTLTQQRGLLWASLLYVLFLTADIITTVRIPDSIRQYLELNPVYAYVGIPGVVALNLICLAIYIILYMRTKNTLTRFIIINMIITVCVIRLFVVYNNIEVYNNQPSVEQAARFAQTNKSEAAIATFQHLAWAAYVPYVISLLSFVLFRKDHVVGVKEWIKQE